MPNPRIIFFGTEDWAARFLEYLIAQDLVPLAVVTKEDKPVGRGLREQYSPVKEVALARDLPIFQPELCSSEKFLNEIRLHKPTLGVLIAYGKILPRTVLAIPEKDFINVHPSLLPLYRGPTPFEAPILKGDSETGISIMRMDDQMDHGAIYAQTRIPLDPTETSQSLKEKVITIGCPLLVETIYALLAGTAVAREQAHERATYTKRFTKETGKIDWSRSALEIERRVRALNPWPGTWTEKNGKRLKILKAVAHAERPEDGSLFLPCGSGYLEIIELHPEGGRSMNTKDFINGGYLQHYQWETLSKYPR